MTAHDDPPRPTVPRDSIRRASSSVADTLPFPNVDPDERPTLRPPEPATEPLDRAGGTDATIAAEGADPAVAAPPSDLRQVDRGEYEVLSAFAEGGIGRILRARDRHLDRTVALKELLARSRGAEERFVREALLTARLQHPGIVPIYEAGRWPSGEPFYAMKLVAGRPLADRIDETRGLDQRLALLSHVLAIAETMAYAHSKRIIHRDLKPENVLVGDYGETVVIDWGLAKDLAADRPEPPTDAAPDERSVATASSGRRRIGGKALTMVGAVMGTPAYMPPEQAYGDPVDERADVYAIGAILYHLIAGEAPYDGETAMAILVKVTTEEPVAIEARQPGVPRELATIVRKAMAERPGDRYPTAKALADDLRRFQAGQFVASHRYSRRERLRRLVQRYRAPLAVGGVALLVVGLVGAISLARIFAARDAAEAARRDAEGRADELALEHARTAVETQPIRALELLAQLHDKSEWRRLRTIAADARAHGIGTQLEGHHGGISRILFSPDGRLVATTSDDCSARLWDTAARETRALVGHTDEVWRAVFSPDGTRVATSSRDASVRIWDVATGAPLQVLRGHTGGSRALTFTHDGAHVVSGGDDDRLLRWDLATGAATELDRCLAGAFVADGGVLACVDLDRRGAVVHDLSEGTRHHLALDVTVNPQTELSSARGELALSRNDQIILWSWRDGQRRVLAGPPQGARALAFSSDGHLLAASGGDGAIRVWRDELRLPDLPHTGSAPRRLAFTPDGGHLLAAGGDSLVHAWRIADGRHREFPGFKDKATALALSPDGRLLAAANARGDARVWDLAHLRDHRLGAAISASATTPERDLAFTADPGGAILTWDLAAGRMDTPSRAILPRPARPLALAHLPSRDQLVIVYEDGLVSVVAADGSPVKTLGSAEPIWQPRLSAAPGDRFIVLHTGARIDAWTLDTGEHRHLVEATQSTRIWLDDHTVALTDGTKAIHAHDLETGAVTRLIEDHLVLRALARTDDGRYILGAGESHALQVLDRESGRQSSVQIANIATIMTIAPIPRTTRALVASGHAEVQIWDFVAGERVGELLGSDVPISMVRATADGVGAITVADDRNVRLWDLESGEDRLLGEVAVSPEEIHYTPSGVVVATSRSGLFAWPDDLPRDANSFLGWLRFGREAITLRSELPADRPACASLEGAR